MTKKKKDAVSISDLKFLCDACDWTEPTTVEVVMNSLGKKCPKCGAVVVEEGDIANLMIMLVASKVASFVYSTTSLEALDVTKKRYIVAYNTKNGFDGSPVEMSDEGEDEQ